MAKKEKEKEKTNADASSEDIKEEKAEESEQETSNESSPEPSQEDILKETVEKLQKELDSSKEAHIRTLAEYDNFRKRTQKEKDAIYSDSKAAIMTELLPVIDNFERAAECECDDLEAYKKGIDMTYSSFIRVLEKTGIEAFGKVGDKFDPNCHNAVMHCEDESLEENVIAEVFSKGYRAGDRILRAAMVKVAN